jgi:hypothetical protein
MTLTIFLIALGGIFVLSIIVNAIKGLPKKQPKFFPVATGYVALGQCWGVAIFDTEGNPPQMIRSGPNLGRTFAGRISRWRWPDGDSFYYLLEDTGAVTNEGKQIQPIVRPTRWWNSPNMTPEKAWKFYINQLSVAERESHPKPQRRRGGGFFIMFPL